MTHRKNMTAAERLYWELHGEHHKPSERPAINSLDAYWRGIANEKRVHGKPLSVPCALCRSDAIAERTRQAAMQEDALSTAYAMELAEDLQDDEPLSTVERMIVEQTVRDLLPIVDPFAFAIVIIEAGEDEHPFERVLAEADRKLDAVDRLWEAQLQHHQGARQAERAEAQAAQERNAAWAETAEARWHPDVRKPGIKPESYECRIERWSTPLIQWRFDDERYVSASHWGLHRA